MKRTYTLLLLAVCTSPLYAQNYRQIHDKAIVVDSHNDILTTAADKKVSFDQNLKGTTHSDLARWKQGGVDVEIFSIWCDGTYGTGKAFAHANRQIDTLYAVARRNPDKMTIVTNTRMLKKAVREHKLAAMIGVEGGHMIEDRLDYLDSLFKRGARYLTLTWNNSTAWATSAMDEHGITALGEDSGKAIPKQKGLTPFGKELVQHMNQLGMMVDVSHVGEQTFWDVINTSTKPVIASHSCVYNICPVFRNLKDDQIKAIGKNRGVIQLNFFSGFLDSAFFTRNKAFALRHKAERDSILKTVTDPFFADNYLFQKYPEEVKALRPPLSLLLDHLDYIVRLIGVDYVGLGSDFDGINSAPQQLDDVTSFPLITQELVNRGYSKKDITKILGGNFLRVLKANEQ